MGKIFDDISKSPQYKQYLEMIPEDRRKEIVESLRKLCEEFEQKILLPLEVLKNR